MWFLSGPVIEQFAPADSDYQRFLPYEGYPESVISLKAETHNFPTTVEPFNGAATGTGGEIHDRMERWWCRFMAYRSGTACYMTLILA